MFLGVSEIPEKTLHKFFKLYNKELEWFDIPDNKINILYSIFDNNNKGERKFFSDHVYGEVLSMYANRSEALKDLNTLGSFLRNSICTLSLIEYNELISIKGVYYELQQFYTLFSYMYK